jgi:hypothetical protein
MMSVDLANLCKTYMLNEFVFSARRGASPATKPAGNYHNPDLGLFNIMIRRQIYVFLKIRVVLAMRSVGI